MKRQGSSGNYKKMHIHYKFIDIDDSKIIYICFLNIFFKKERKPTQTQRLYF